MKTLLVFSHLRWNFVFQRPQHLLTRLSAFYNIIFVEEPIVGHGAALVETKLDNIMTLVPHTNAEGWGFNDAQLHVITPMVQQYLIDNGITEYGIWFYTPQAFPLKYALNPEFVVFDVMDELSMFAGAPPELKQREADLLKVADVVIAGGPSLARAKQAARPDVLCLPSSVDANHYSPKRALEAEAELHDEDRLEHDIPHPRIGFFGVIDERLDIDLVKALAAADPSWQIVMVGPVVKIDPASLPQATNIHWLGQQSYAILPQLVQQWDVCILPFALNDSTKFISPTKTLEYMAAEKPIVSTAVHDVVELYGDIVAIAHDQTEFIAQVHMLLNEPETHRAERIFLSLETVKSSSWNATAEKVHEAIEAAIAKKTEVAHHPV